MTSVINFNTIKNQDLRTRANAFVDYLENSGVTKLLSDNKNEEFSDFSDSSDSYFCENNFYSELKNNGFLDIDGDSTIPYVFFSSGASRNVIGSAEFGCVLKFDTDTRDFVSDYGELIEYGFSHIEYEVYEKAKSKGLEEYFVEIFPVREINDVMLYAAEYVYVDDTALSDESLNYDFKVFCEEQGYDEKDSDSWDAYWDAAGNSGWSSGDHNGMFNFAAHEWGKDTAAEVEDFLDYLGIGDCHSGNWGRTLETGKLILTDYAGYREVNLREFGLE